MTEIDIEKLGQMAKLALTDTEKNDISKYMEFLEDDFDNLDNVDTGSAKPLIHGVELVNILREDRVVKDIDRDKLLETAPEHSDGYFVAPKTID